METTRKTRRLHPRIAQTTQDDNKATAYRSSIARARQARLSAVSPSFLIESSSGGIIPQPGYPPFSQNHAALPRNCKGGDFIFNISFYLSSLEQPPSSKPPLPGMLVSATAPNREHRRCLQTGTFRSNGVVPDDRSRNCEPETLRLAGDQKHSSDTTRTTGTKIMSRRLEQAERATDSPRSNWTRLQHYWRQIREHAHHGRSFPVSASAGRCLGNLTQYLCRVVPGRARLHRVNSHVKMATPIRSRTQGIIPFRSAYSYD